jgi:predicted nucleic acid-binding protein
VLVPSFFLVEVSGALSRLGFDGRAIRRVVRSLTMPPHEIVTVGPRAAKAAQDVAIRAKLRGPDALYVWLARREGAPLYTLDREILSRGGAFCQVATP